MACPATPPGKLPERPAETFPGGTPLDDPALLARAPPVVGKPEQIKGPLSWRLIACSASLLPCWAGELNHTSLLRVEGHPKLCSRPEINGDQKAITRRHFSPSRVPRLRRRRTPLAADRDGRRQGAYVHTDLPKGHIVPPQRPAQHARKRPRRRTGSGHAVCGGVCRRVTTGRRARTYSQARTQCRPAQAASSAPLLRQSPSPALRGAPRDRRQYG